MNKKKLIVTLALIITMYNLQAREMTFSVASNVPTLAANNIEVQTECYYNKYGFHRTTTDKDVYTSSPLDIKCPKKPDGSAFHSGIVHTYRVFLNDGKGNDDVNCAVTDTADENKDGVMNITKNDSGYFCNFTEK